jgi:hypothetical protein
MDDPIPVLSNSGRPLNLHFLSEGLCVSTKVLSQQGGKKKLFRAEALNVLLTTICILFSSRFTCYNNKIRFHYNIRPPSAVSFIPTMASTSGRLHSEFVRLLFLQTHRETDRFFTASGVQSAQSSSEFFHFRRAAFLQQIKSKVDLVLAKTVVLRVVLNLDGVPIASKSHSHPSHSQTSRLLTSSLSLGLPVPRPTQCVRGA